MNQNPNGTDALFDIIRKELNTIIENSEKKVQVKQEDKKQSKPSGSGQKNIENAPTSSKAITTTKTDDTQSKSKTTKVSEKKVELKQEDKKQSKQSGTGQKKNIESAPTSSKAITTTKTDDTQSKSKTTKVSEKSTTKPSPTHPRLNAGKEVKTTFSMTPSSVRSENKEELPIQPKFQSTLENDIAIQTALLSTPRTKNIDADLQRMQIELQDSYNLFQGISEKFESINFQNLQKRIKELNLSRKREAVGASRSDELKAMVDEGFKTNRLKELTSKVGDQFNRHPGEFGNIPELSTFFQACTQLEQVLGTLNRQHNDVHELEDRMRKSAQSSYDRINYIKNQLQEMKLQQKSPQENSEDI